MKIAVINATKVSIEPVDQAAKEYSNLEIFHFMDEGMSWLGKQEGKISGKNLSRMISLIHSAEELGVDGILLSCTIFSPFIDCSLDYVQIFLLLPQILAYLKKLPSYIKRLERLYLLHRH